VDTAPRFFGPEESPLFGCYQAPTATPRPCGVVLCYPFGQEYMRAHRAFRILATRLAALGFPVLRFDYYGCGDSAGDGGDLSRWQEDICRAVEELKRQGGVRRVALAGLRLGGSLAALAAAGRNDVDSLVLWDPVVSGQSYLDELISAHRHWSDGHRSDDGEQDGLEVLGFSISPALQQHLREMTLAPSSFDGVARVLIVEDDKGDAARLASPSPDANGRIEYQNLPSRLGMHPGDLGKVWIPGQTIQAIAQWLAQRTA